MEFKEFFKLNFARISVLALALILISCSQTTNDKPKIESSNHNFSILGRACTINEVVAVLMPNFDSSVSITLNLMHYQYSDKNPPPGTWPASIHRRLIPSGESSIIKTMPIGKKELKNGKLEVVRAELDGFGAGEILIPYDDVDICFDNECTSIKCYLNAFECPGPEKCSYQPANCLIKSLDKEICEADRECIFEGFCQRMDCQNIKTEAKCNSLVACGWGRHYYPSSGDKSCGFKSCIIYDTQQECESNILGCKWDNKWWDSPKAMVLDEYFCRSASCYEIAIKSICESSDFGCKWRDNYCLGPLD